MFYCTINGLILYCVKLLTWHSCICHINLYKSVILFDCDNLAQVHNYRVSAQDINLSSVESRLDSFCTFYRNCSVIRKQYNAVSTR